MSKQTHTPGPWHVAGNEIHDRLTRYDEDGARIGSTATLIADVGFVPGGAEEREANARLIAAAPELLSVLQELQESAAYWSEYDVPLGIVQRINDAIAKAGGAS